MGFISSRRSPLLFVFLLLVCVFVFGMAVFSFADNVESLGAYEDNNEAITEVENKAEEAEYFENEVRQEMTEEQPSEEVISTEEEQPSEFDGEETPPVNGEVIYMETIGIDDVIKADISGIYQNTGIMVYFIVPLLLSLAVAYLFYKFVYLTFCR